MVSVTVIYLFKIKIALSLRNIIASKKSIINWLDNEFLEGQLLIKTSKSRGLQHLKMPLSDTVFILNSFLFS